MVRGCKAPFLEQGYYLDEMFDASFADFDAELSENSNKPVHWVTQTANPVDRQTLKEQRRYATDLISEIVTDQR